MPVVEVVVVVVVVARDPKFTTWHLCGGWVQAAVG